MNLDGPETARTTRTRPKDRREQILQQAVVLFAARGFGNVTMADIAAAVGITAGAMYRHYGSKDDLLIEAISRCFRRYDAFLQLEHPDRDRFLIDLVDLGLDNTECAILWHRDIHHLAPQQQRVFRARMRRLNNIVSDQLGTAWDLPERELLTWGLSSALMSPARHSPPIDKTKVRAVLSAVVRALVTDPKLFAVTQGGQAPVSVGLDRERVSRREALLSAAADLFDRQGYASVSMSDLGAAIGVTGPNVYSYFASKEDLLYATLTRGNDALQLELTFALRQATSSQDALSRAIQSFIDVSVRVPFSAEGIANSLLELPEHRREGLRQAQQEYLAEWIWLLRQSRPELREVEARILTQAALTMVGSCVRIWSLRQRPDLAAELRQMAAVILNTQLTHSGRSEDLSA